MIIPVKCFTCGKIIGHKYNIYLKEIAKEKQDDEEEIKYLNTHNVKKTTEGIILDKIGLTDICCRRHFLTHVDIIS